MHTYKQTTIQTVHIYIYIFILKMFLLKQIQHDLIWSHVICKITTTYIKINNILSDCLIYDTSTYSETSQYIKMKYTLIKMLFYDFRPDKIKQYFIILIVALKEHAALKKVSFENTLSLKIIHITFLQILKIILFSMNMTQYDTIWKNLISYKIYEYQINAI